LGNPGELRENLCFFWRWMRKARGWEGRREVL
jgi:hypothetical protein